MQFRQREGVEIRSVTVSTYQGFNEMVQYVNVNPGVNYYDVLAYAYVNDKDLWLFALSKDSKTIQKYIKSKMEKENLTFARSLHKSHRIARKSEKDYYTRHKLEFQ